MMGYISTEHEAVCARRDDIRGAVLIFLIRFVHPLDVT